MGVHEGRGTLAKAMKELMLRWNDVHSAWNDSRTEEFEQAYLIPLQSDLKNAVAAMDHIAIQLSQARRDCE